MSVKANNFKIGLFVIAALVMLVLGILAFGARSYFQQKTKFETVVAGDASGLSVGSAVEFHGVTIGKVTRIDFCWNVYPESKKGDIVVEFEAQTNILRPDWGKDKESIMDTAIKKGMRAVVKSQGITGVSTLSLEFLDPEAFPAPELTFKPRHIYIPAAPAKFSRMLDALETVLHNLEPLNFSEISTSATNALNTANKLAEKLDRLDIQKLADNADATVVELKSTARTLQETLKGLDLQSVSTNADALLIGLRATNTKLQTVLDHVDEVPLQKTVGDIRQAVETLNGVLLELKTYPSGFIFGQPPPPAKSVKPSKE